MTHTTRWAVYRLGHLGDVVLATGVLEHWRRTRGMSFVFITRRGNGPVLAGHPAVERVVELEEHELKGRAWWARCRELAAEFSDCGLVDLHCTLRSRLLSLAWKSAVRRYPKFSLRRRLYHRTRLPALARPLEELSVPQRYAMAFDSPPPQADQLLPVMHLSDLERAEAASLPAVNNTLVTGRPLVALHPYATHPDKAWPREHWLRLTELLSDSGMDWICLGRDNAPLFPGQEQDLTNATNLRQTCAVLERAQVLVTSDSGPMHLASAVSTPVCAFFGPTARAWGFYPQGSRDRVLERSLDCRPCSLHGKSRCTRGRECLAGISPEEAMTTIRSIIEESR